MLYPIRDVLELSPGSNLPECTAAESEALRGIADWSMTYLCGTHSQLGRAGPVCPWTPPSIKYGHYWLAIQRTQGVPLGEILERMLERLESMQEMEPRTGRDVSLKTVVVVFPDLDPDSAGPFIDDLHARLKPLFVSQGFMLGEFYPSCSKRGLRNQDFRPLRSPIPLLVIRDMVQNDIAFLTDRRDFVEAYVQKHGLSGCDEIFGLINKDRNRTTIDSERVALLFDVVHKYAKFTRAEKKIDLVTGLFNSDYLYARLGAAFARRALGDPPVSLILMRLDNIGEIESSCDRAAADLIMWELARIIEDEARASDLVAVVDQDKFAILLTSEDKAAAPALTRRLYGRVSEKLFQREGVEIPVVVSFATGLQQENDTEPVAFFKNLNRKGWEPSLRISNPPPSWQPVSSPRSRR